MTTSFSPGLDGVIAADTKVSYLDVDQEQIVIRGYDLIELARRVRYADVAYLVIHGALPTPEQSKAFQQTLAEQADLPDEMYRLFDLMPKSTVAMDALRTGVSFLAGFEPPDLIADNSHEANLRKGIRLLAQMPTVAINAYRALNGMPIVRPDPSLGYTENILHMVLGQRPTPQALDAFDRIHVCYIDHEMPASTFSARVIASSLADIHGAMTGAVASLKGPLHGGANEAAIQMLLDILNKGGAGKAESYMMTKLRQKARIMGFGHRVYMKKYDPRALFLRDYIPALASQVPEGEELRAISETVEMVMKREKGLFPNTDFPIGLLYYLLRIPVPLYTPLFYCSRAAGLVAQIVEQHDDNRLFRPRVIYSGPRGLRPPQSRPTRG